MWLSMAEPRATPAGAVSGAPVEFSAPNLFDWLFSNPFESENAYTPAERLVPRIENDRPIFVDNATGTLRIYAAEDASRAISHGCDKRPQN